MVSARYTTVPVRCPACGQQTHKTLDAIVRDKGLLCSCGVKSDVDTAQFADEIKKCEANIKDFGRDPGSGR